MGDGRYYTYRQFFQILYLTILSGGLVFTIFYIQIKSREKERIRYIVISSCFLLFTVLLSFIKEVSYNLYTAEVLTYLSLLGIIGAMVTQIIYYNKKVTYTIMISLFVLLATRFHYIDNFTYIITNYSMEYQLLVILCASVLFAYIILDIRKSYKNLKKSFKLNGLKRYEWLESITTGTCLFITVLSYIVHILTGTMFPLVQLCLLICIVGFNLTFRHFMPHERIPAGYHSLLENMMDTIIILNEKKNILYMNETELSHIINPNIMVDFKHLNKLLLIENTKIIKLSPEVEQINGVYNEKVISCKISYKSITSKDKHVGFVIVIEDCSPLEAMIDDLRIKKQNLSDLEKELSQYNRMSEVLKAEKERNRLLIEVQNELGHHLAELSKYIGNTIDFTKHESLQDQENCELLINSIVQGITMARMNLSKIRETVKTYRSSYDGKEKNDDKSIVSR